MAVSQKLIKIKHYNQNIQIVYFCNSKMFRTMTSIPIGLRCGWGPIYLKLLNNHYCYKSIITTVNCIILGLYKGSKSISQIYTVQDQTTNLWWFIPILLCQVVHSYNSILTPYRQVQTCFSVYQVHEMINNGKIFINQTR